MPDKQASGKLGIHQAVLNLCLRLWQDQSIWTAWLWGVKLSTQLLEVDNTQWKIQMCPTFCFICLQSLVIRLQNKLQIHFLINSFILIKSFIRDSKHKAFKAHGCSLGVQSVLIPALLLWMKLNDDFLFCKSSFRRMETLKLLSKFLRRLH